MSKSQRLFQVGKVSILLGIGLFSQVGLAMDEKTSLPTRLESIELQSLAEEQPSLLPSDSQSTLREISEILTRTEKSLEQVGEDLDRMKKEWLRIKPILYKRLEVKKRVQKAIEWSRLMRNQPPQGTATLIGQSAEAPSPNHEDWVMCELPAAQPLNQAVLHSVNSALPSVPSSSQKREIPLIFDDEGVEIVPALANQNSSSFSLPQNGEDDFVDVGTITESKER